MVGCFYLGGPGVIFIGGVVGSVACGVVRVRFRGLVGHDAFAKEFEEVITADGGCDGEEETAHVLVRDAFLTHLPCWLKDRVLTTP